MKGKVIFEDLYSMFKRPTVEKEFDSEKSLKNLLNEFGNSRYGQQATIYIDGERLMIFAITEYGGWRYEKSP